ncbi:hypothetical protein D3C75_223950 [compost metagenome]
MLTSWFTASFPSKPPIPGFRYKQTAVTFINDAYATYDGGGYAITLNNTGNIRGDACTAKYTYDPAKGDVIAVAFTRTRNPSVNCSSNIQYQNSVTLASFYVGVDNRLYFNGTAYTVGTIVANKVDIALELNMSTKMIKAYYSLTVGGPKILVAEKPFLNVVASNAIQLYVDGPNSSASNLQVYNNAEFTL